MHQLFIDYTEMISFCSSLGGTVQYITAVYVQSGVGTHWVTGKNEINASHPTYQSIHHGAKQAAIHQVTAMLATPKDVLFPGHNHLLYLYTCFTCLDINKNV